MKITLTRDTLHTQKSKGFFGIGKKVDVKDVYRVITSHNFRARPWYLPTELDYLMDIGVKIEIK